MKGLGGSPLVSMMEASHLRKFHRRAQFGRLLERYRKLWDQKKLPELARILHEFADRLERRSRGSKTKAKT